MKEFLKKHKYVLIIIAVIMIVFTIIKALALPALFDKFDHYLNMLDKSKGVDDVQTFYNYLFEAFSSIFFCIVAIIFYISLAILCVVYFFKVYQPKTKLEKQQILLQKKQNEVEKLQKKIDKKH